MERESEVAESIWANENRMTRRRKGAFLGYSPPEANAKYSSVSAKFLLPTRGLFSLLILGQR